MFAHNINFIICGIMTESLILTQVCDPPITVIIIVNNNNVVVVVDTNANVPKLFMGTLIKFIG